VRKILERKSRSTGGQGARSARGGRVLMLTVACRASTGAPENWLPGTRDCAYHAFDK